MSTISARPSPTRGTSLDRAKVLKQAPAGAKHVLVDGEDVLFFEHWVHVATEHEKRPDAVVWDVAPPQGQLVAASATIKR